MWEQPAFSSVRLFFWQLFKNVKLLKEKSPRRHFYTSTFERLKSFHVSDSTTSDSLVRNTDRRNDFLGNFVDVWIGSSVLSIIAGDSCKNWNSCQLKVWSKSRKTLPRFCFLPFLPLGIMDPISSNHTAKSTKSNPGLKNQATSFLDVSNG